LLQSKDRSTERPNDLGQSLVNQPPGANVFSSTRV
jgi:hypothetical protein